MTRPLRVVVADDEPDMRLLLRLQLSQVPGLEVVGEAADGAEAVSLIAVHRPDAAVIDLLMPGTSGFEAIATLQEQHRQLGIVAYTAVAGDFVRNEMSRMGVELVLKSGDFDPLVAAIRRAAGVNGDSRDASHS